MSLRTALQVVGLLAAGYLLIVVLLAMGPIGLFVFGPLLVIGAVQVYRNRTRRGGSESVSESPSYCRHCGAAIDVDAFDDEREADGPWEVRYCPDCGAPLEPETKTDRGADTVETGSAGRTKNCPDCGAPNEPDRTTCTHCDAEL
ncbi:hypothetical protein [Natronorubrum sp. FCH18a]|uniref:hypothetical protein n=1 Tax=Natronorubrum sp. FCH18a TaxID=3447018 RepID=UPI003F519291